ncbi:NADPH-dependent FMN reductase [Motiliproteus sp. MSK22-1]|uniref:NADPH-dependent FMN reductase n=1 Tax=Motiliproteus sp. MSK22-1 TaxID=1897630 RepID=UPI000977A1E7|nr:NAD(P)H-dependent oxidoreductase [Motiliproteus sp. MSK22-1]OMH33987.1 FMN reductase [Motiliproteus sp. MSK22-1]
MENTNHRTPKVIVLAGSLRKGSYNRTLVRIAGQGAQASGAQIVNIDLADYEIPLFSEEIEAIEGAPAGVKDLKRLFRDAQGILLASPEYNGSISGVLKNAIDWISRPDPDADGVSAFSGKIVGLMSASPGGLGGLRGLNHVRDIFTALGSYILPSQVAVAEAYKAFDEDGNLNDSAQTDRVQSIGAEVVRVAIKLNN